MGDGRRGGGRNFKAVSVELTPLGCHVGRFFAGQPRSPSYFKTIRNCLRPGAHAVPHAITVSDDHYVQYCRRCNWIQKYFLPGGHLPSLESVTDHEKLIVQLEAVETCFRGSINLNSLLRYRGIRPISHIGSLFKYHRDVCFSIGYLDHGGANTKVFNII